MSNAMRLSCKVVERDGKRYLCPVGWYNRASDRMLAIALSEEGTHEIELTPEEWNDLPYFWFQEDGPAPKPLNRVINLPLRRRQGD